MKYKSKKEYEDSLKDEWQRNCFCHLGW
jgi:hypothetical protein